MKFSLVFENSGDEIPFKVKYNHDLFAFFVDKAVKNTANLFSDNRLVYENINTKINHLHWAVSSTNSILSNLTGKSFTQHENIEHYLDQKYLNKLHSDWVFSHYDKVNIDDLRFSSNNKLSKLGNQLHDVLPDDIRVLETAVAMEKVGYSYQYHEVNMGIHRLESAFNDIEYKADSKWNVFENPFTKTMVSNNDIVNFGFGYTYVGRQNYNKFQYFDLELENPDFYNYEHLEFAFQLNLQKPETISFSKEFLQWCKDKNISPISTQLPIANIIDLDSKLFDYRKILYRNSKDNNQTHIELK